MADVIESICPSCGADGDVIEGKCRKCGARKTINQVSGNVIWMRNGRIVRAFEDERQAYVRIAEQYGIPREQWPEDFRAATIQGEKDGN
jgi:predicted ATP-dependent serine protease